VASALELEDQRLDLAVLERTGGDHATGALKLAALGAVQVRDLAPLILLPARLAHLVFVQRKLEVAFAVEAMHVGQKLD